MVSVKEAPSFEALECWLEAHPDLKVENIKPVIVADAQGNPTKYVLFYDAPSNPEK